MVTSACKRRVRCARGARCSSRGVGALKMSIDAGGALRFQNVYRLRR